ncbi:MAG TPA: nucleotide exchange factor GrpE [Actinomycetota bacterium]|nr:nucleotide exchange factor GrpE [Actinomycetota bacterium]
MEARNGSTRTAETPATEGQADDARGTDERDEQILRLAADFENFKRQAARRETEARERAVRGVIEDLLPVLDNFERAIAHGEGGEGVELVFKELKATLESAGLEEVSGEGSPFDPQVHEGVDSREDESVTEEVVRAVHRRGYTMNGKLLRAAMVGVSRPAAPEPVEEEVTEE